MPSAVHTAPLERCRGTVAPLAQSLGQDVQVEPVLAEDAYRDDPAGARRRLVELASAEPDGGSIVVCSQGGVIPGVVKSLAGLSDVPIGEVSTPTAAYWFLSFDGRRLVQADSYPSPIVCGPADRPRNTADSAGSREPLPPAESDGTVRT
jgi:8-oxo-dGTP diphosphatase